MTDRYRWDASEIHALWLNADATHNALVAALASLKELTSDMKADTTWNGKHKLAFMAWMDLVEQYLTKLVDDGIGPAACRALQTFWTDLSHIHSLSEACRSLDSVG